MLPCGFQQPLASVGHVEDVLHGGNVVGVLPQIDELAQAEVWRELDVLDVFHGTLCFV